MKLSLSALTLLASAVSAAVTDVGLYIESSNKEVDGNGLSPLHEGAGIQYLFLGTNSYDFEYDSEEGVISGPNPPDAPFASNFSIVDHVAWTSITATTKVTVDDGLLAINGSTDGFYAAKNINDPYNYSQKEYALVYYPEGSQPSDAISVKVKVVEGKPAQNSTSSSASSAAPSVSPASGAAGTNAVGGAIMGGAALLAMLI